ncbi:hypothetical protein [Komagataeibacter kakiaceti]|uniref:hypothetical protein n=1 Tax=Komagataeibacter kakiaceti TaxID=943261 RepID=UPI000688D4A0|nr:hypothetical protein [Komagataeibacter kakiaceti]
MTVHNYARHTGEYRSTSDVLLARGVGIPALATTTDPPDAKEGFARVFVNGAWSHVEDHRGEVWYDRDTGRAVKVSGLGPVDPAVHVATKPVITIPLATQAATALAQARTHVLHHYKLLDEPTPAVWIAYLKALMAISDGTDTASTVLPARPAQ